MITRILRTLSVVALTATSAAAQTYNLPAAQTVSSYAVPVQTSGTSAVIGITNIAPAPAYAPEPLNALPVSIAVIPIPVVPLHVVCEYDSDIAPIFFLSVNGIGAASVDTYMQAEDAQYGYVQVAQNNYTFAGKLDIDLNALVPTPSSGQVYLSFAGTYPAPITQASVMYYDRDGNLVREVNCVVVDAKRFK